MLTSVMKGRDRYARNLRYLPSTRPGFLPLMMSVQEDQVTLSADAATCTVTVPLPAALVAQL